MYDHPSLIELKSALKLTESVNRTHPDCFSPLPRPTHDPLCESSIIRTLSYNCCLASRPEKSDHTLVYVFGYLVDYVV